MLTNGNLLTLFVYLYTYTHTSTHTHINAPTPHTQHKYISVYHSQILASIWPLDNFTNIVNGRRKCLQATADQKYTRTTSVVNRPRHGKHLHLTWKDDLWDNIFWLHSYKRWSVLRRGSGVGGLGSAIHIGVS